MKTSSLSEVWPPEVEENLKRTFRTLVQHLRSRTDVQNIDLMNLADALLLPQDDLNLACLLKSPLVGLDEEQLFTLAYKRPGHLWRSLRTRKLNMFTLIGLGVAVA